MRQGTRQIPIALGLLVALALLALMVRSSAWYTTLTPAFDTAPHTNLLLILLLVSFVAVRLLLSSTTEGDWSAYHISILTISWFLLDDGALLVFLIVSHVFIASVRAWWYRPSQRQALRIALEDMLFDMVCTAYALFIGRLMNLQLGVTGSLSADYFNQHLNEPYFIWAVAYSLHQLLRIAITADWRGFFRYTSQHFLRDAGLGFIAIIITTIYYQFNPIAFIVILGLIVFQALRVTQMRFARQALLNRISEISTLSNLVRSDQRGLDAQVIMQSIYQEVRKSLPFEAFFIVQNDEENYGIRYNFVRINHQEVFDWQVPSGINDMVQIALQRRAYLLSTSCQDQFQPQTIGSYESVLIVPLQVGMKLLGAIAILHTQAHQYHTYHVVRLQNIAFQASLLLRNALLYQDSVKLTQQLALINEVMQPSLINMNTDVALTRACELACNIAESSKAAIFLLKETSTRPRTITHSFVMVAQSGIASTPHTIMQSIPIQHQLERYDAGFYIVNDIATTQNTYTREMAERIGFEACLEIPLKSAHRIVGYLAVYHEHPRYYTPSLYNLLGMMSHQISALLDNTDMLETLERYATEQAQLAHLTRITTASLELDAVIYNTCQSLRDLLASDKVEIALITNDDTSFDFYRLNDDAQVTVLYDGMSAEALGITIEPVDASHIPEFNALMYKATYHMQHVTRQDDNLSPFFADWLHSRQMDNVMVVPMTIKNEMVGFMLVGHGQPCFYDENDLRLIEMTCNQISLQIHNARIHTTTNATLRQRLTELGMIENIAQQISQALNQHHIMQGVLEAALQSTQADLAVIALLDNDGDYETITQERINGDTITQTRRMKLEYTLINIVQKNNEPLIAPDLSRFPTYHPLGSQPYTSILAVPIASGDDAIGVLSLESHQHNFFTLEQLSFLQGIAGHASISIENAKLLAERQHQIMTLNELRQLTLEATRIVTQEAMGSLVLQKAISLLGGIMGVLYAYDDTSDSLTLMSHGIFRDRAFHVVPVQTVPTRIKDFIADDAIQVLSPSNLPMMVEDKRCENTLIIPMKRRERTTHVMLIGFETAWRLGGQARRTADLLAVQVASHLENANLNEAIRKQNDQMRAILNANRDGIILLDRDGYLQEANPASATILNIPLNAHLNQPYKYILNEYLPTAENGESIYQEMIDHIDQNLTDLTTRHYSIRQAGRSIYIQEIGVPVTDSENNIVGRLLSLRDITEEKMLNEYRQRLQSMLYHDLRSPLGAIISGLYLTNAILDDPQDMPIVESVAPTLKVVLDSATYLLSLLDTLRDIPRLEKGQMPLRRKNVLVQNVAEHAFTTLMPSMQAVGLQNQTEIAPNLPELWLDEELIQRVFINLIHNAFKFTPNGGTVLIDVRPYNDQTDYLLIRVCDTGPGIPPAMRERIFNEFEQIEGQKPSHGGKGSGLGLTFCKLAIEAHGGRIWVEPEGILSGACFAFTLPTMAQNENQAKR